MRAALRYLGKTHCELDHRRCANNGVHCSDSHAEGQEPYAGLTEEEGSRLKIGRCIVRSRYLLYCIQSMERAVQTATPLGVAIQQHSYG